MNPVHQFDSSAKFWTCLSVLISVRGAPAIRCQDRQPGHCFYFLASSLQRRWVMQALVNGPIFLSESWYWMLHVCCCGNFFVIPVVAFMVRIVVTNNCVSELCALGTSLDRPCSQPAAHRVPVTSRHCFPVLGLFSPGWFVYSCILLEHVLQ